MKYLPSLLLFFGCQQSEHYLDIKYPEGGYAYPKTINSRDSGFFFYPLIDSMSLVDSVGYTQRRRFVYSAFNEPNLSLRPNGEDLFRFYYSNSEGKILFVTVTQKEVVIKMNGKEYPYSSPHPAFDTMRLASLERLHYETLERWFPIQEAIADTLSTKSRYQLYQATYLDSLTKEYPELLSATYFMQLKEKCRVPVMPPFKYVEKHISITNAQFLQWVDLLNQSGYWEMPSDDNSTCGAGAMDGYGFSLEANTAKKYNFVEWNSCHNPNDSAFRKVGDFLIGFTKTAEEFEKEFR